MNQSKTLGLRQTPPAIKLVEFLPMPNHRTVELEGGVTLHLLEELDTTGFRIDFIFSAGIKHNLLPTTASAAFNLMTEGTLDKSSEQIHDRLDFYGSFLEKDIAFNHSKLTLFGTEPNFEDIYLLIKEIITTPSFASKEIQLYANRQKQRLLVDLQKNGSLSKRAFAKEFWGTNHPLGNLAEPADYDRIDQKDLKQFYENHIGSGLMHIVVSGCCSSKIVKLIQETKFISREKATGFNNSLSKNKSSKGLLFVQKNDSIQAAIHMGIELVNRKHEDFVSLQVASTLLGGYFGSRLMKNIREEKGYTYGIGCGLQNIADRGVFSIHTEVLNDKWDETTSCIDFEINKLKKESIPEDELQTVKNYMCGNLARMFDGSFSQADRLQMLLSENLSWDYYTSYIDSVKNTSAERIQLLANKYLDSGLFTTIVVGNK